jgi:hypothetical protein
MVDGDDRPSIGYLYDVIHYVKEKKCYISGDFKRERLECNLS